MRFTRAESSVGGRAVRVCARELWQSQGPGKGRVVRLRRRAHRPMSDGRVIAVGGVGWNKSRLCLAAALRRGLWGFGIWRGSRRHLFCFALLMSLFCWSSRSGLRSPAFSNLFSTQPRNSHLTSVRPSQEHPIRRISQDKGSNWHRRAASRPRSPHIAPNDHPRKNVAPGRSSSMNV
jgi:hypothetical protein